MRPVFKIGFENKGTGFILGARWYVMRSTYN